jgi:glycosyltransferase involved in cell wall biosynthesis
MGTTGKRVIAVVWGQYGPYHFARLRELQRRSPDLEVLGVELGTVTTTYSWDRDDREAAIHSLLPGQAAEKVSALAVYRKSLAFFREHGVSVVFVPSYWPASSVTMMVAARQAGARLVLMNDSHDGTAQATGLKAGIKRFLVRRFDSALVAGTPHFEYISGMGLDRSRIVTGYDAVDNDFFTTHAARARADAPAVSRQHDLPQRYFLSVGRLIGKKNIETLIDAYGKVRGELGTHCPALVLVGSGELEASLRARCAGLGLSTRDDVHFFGYKQVSQLPGIYALAECFVLPSLQEEWGLVVNEAMACGLPVLVSRTAGCARDLVEDGRNGFLFDPMDAETLAERLVWIAQRPQLARSMGAASSQLIAQWGCPRFADAAREALKISLGKRGD